MPKWLNTAVFYEVYPQSFFDTNGDGIGDINGITEKLDYILSLGCNALWINPCFDSPFHDAGYDVRDYKKVAPRYGTNDDLIRCFQEAHRRGMHVLLDLVPGHTSEEHPWFLDSQKAEPGPYRDRYIWTGFAFQNAGGLPFIGGESQRNASYILNFFKCQPALNYGFLSPDQDWQFPVNHPSCIATREAMKDIMRFWLDQGCDGFRVDMAFSLVKNDDEVRSGTSAIWKDVRKMLDQEYPEAAIVAEWGNPELSLPAGFHMDFYLNEINDTCGYRSLMRNYQGTFQNRVINDQSYFKKDSPTDVSVFLQDYLPRYKNSRQFGFFCFLTCNHDTLRPRANLTPQELKLAYGFLFTMPGVPFLYYGDEIGMRYLDLPTKEGGYHRTGSRTPMQWTGGKNLGFSTASPEALYLPVDPSPDAPTVESEEKDENSLLHTVRSLLFLRSQYPDLQASSSFEVISARPGEKLFAYRRGNLTILINPGSASISLPVEATELLFLLGSCRLEGGCAVLDGQSFAVLK